MKIIVYPMMKLKQFGYGLNKERMNNEKKAKVTNRIALLFFYITNLIMGFVYYGFTTFMPIHFAENTKEFLPFISDTMKAGVFPSFVFLSGVIGQIIGGKLGTHFNRIRILPYIIAINIPFLLFNFNRPVFISTSKEL